MPSSGGAGPPRPAPDRSPGDPLTEPFDFSELLDDFRDEARGQLARLDDVLLSLGAGGPVPVEAHADLLRALHTLKGNSGMLGLRPLQDFVHTLEGSFRAGGTPAAAALDPLRDAAAALHRAVDRVGTEEQEAAFAALTRLRPALEGLPSQDPAGASPAVAAGEAPVPPGEGGTDEEAGPRADDLRSDVVRVPFARLETLLHTVTELTASVTALEHWAGGARDALEAAGLRRPLRDRLEQVAAALEETRRGAAELRTVPVRRVFARFPALAADLARRQGKQVRVILEDAGTELDKSSADALMEPLLHLVRNAIDHGIETPGERDRAGKPEEGRLWLRAAQEGERVRIEVEDDGRGIDTAAVEVRARELGLASEQGLDDAAAGELLFRPGFSTRATADEVSGRGVGLDVVRGTLTRLRGSVEVEPGAEQGTCFVLRLPVAVAMVSVLVFERGGEVMALPTADVDETLRADASTFEGPAEMAVVRGEPLPLLAPERVFGWGALPEPRFLVVTRSGARAAAVAADRLIDQRAAAIRGLPRALGTPTGVSGATVDPAGRVVLLLDPAGLLTLNVDLYRGGAGAG
jgi:two-component system, chemotaxis family, sensor kinase CheA